MKIALVDDHMMIREMLRRVCSERLGYEVVGEADDGLRALEMISAKKPDVVFLDLEIPSLDGFDVLDEIRRRGIRSRVMVISARCDEYTVARLEQARVDGFVDKRVDTIERVQKALKTVAEKGQYFCEIFTEVKRRMRKDPLSYDKILTPRQLAVLRHMSDLLTDAEIAKELGIGERTVESHRTAIMGKLGLRSREELERYARDRGLSSKAVPRRL